MNKLQAVETEYLRSVPDFRPGDTVKVHVRVVEGSRERVQVFQGVVIRRQGGGLRETFTVRKVSFGVGVERTFPVHSPSIAKLEVITRGRVRRAKLYYLRDRRGKKARIKERRDASGNVIIEQQETIEEPALETDALDADVAEAEEAADETPIDEAPEAEDPEATDDSAEADEASGEQS